MKRKKILVFARDSSVPPVTGASGVSTWGLAKGLAGNGCDITVVSKMFHSRIFPLARDKNILVLRLPRYPYFLTKYVWPLELFLASFLLKPDAVILRVPEKIFIADLKYFASAIRRISAKVVVKPNFVPEHWAENIELLFKTGDYILCETEGHKKVLPEKARKKSILMDNGIDLELFNYKKTAEKKGNTDYIILLGSVDSHRSTLPVLNAFSRTKLAATKKLRIIGTGPDIQKVKRRAKELGIEDKIEFTGLVEHATVPSLIKNAFLGIVLPSDGAVNYTSPLKLFEFLAMGVPVLTRKELSSAASVPGECKVIAGSCSEKDIQAAMEKAMSFGAKTIPLCVRAAEGHSWENNVKPLLEAFEND